MRTLILKQYESKNKFCPICGRPYIHTVMQSSTGNIIECDEPACECEKNERDRKGKEKMQKSRQEKIIKIFNNSLMDKLVPKTTFAELEPTRHLEFCRNYAKQFQPDKSKGLQLVGSVGTGKTTLLAAICHNLMQRNYTCLLITFSSLLDIFSKYSFENAGNISYLLDWLVKIDFIALDDYGRENYTEKRIEFAFKIADKLILHNKTISISANQDRINKLKEIPGMDATIDRVKTLCPTLLEFKGESLRGKS